MTDEAPESARATTGADPSEANPRRARLHTEAVQRRGRWPGMVWAIPLAAFLVVAYLGVQALANRGIDVVVTFKNSGGARAGDTPVIYKGVTVGRVVRIQIAENAQDVDMTLRLDRHARSHLGKGAKFWLIGAQPSLTDLSSLKAAVSGVSVGVSPGVGPPEQHFYGMELPPAVPPDTPGTLYVLEGGEVGSTREGSGVYFHGLPVGRVTRVGVGDATIMRMTIFVNAGFDRLVRPGTLFFNANAANVSVQAGHFNASLGPGSSVITGGIEFDTPATAANQPQARERTVFHYYPSEFQAADQPKGPQVRYRAVFQAATERPGVDAPVWLSGVRVGRVLETKVTLPRGATAPATDVTLEIEPQKLDLPLNGDARASTDAALRDLIRGGYRLAMGQYPPLIGTGILVFQRNASAHHASLGGASLGEGDVGVIPTASSTGIDDLTGKLDTILDKVNAVPIEAIGQDVRQITSHLNRLVSSPQLTDSLSKLDSTLTSVDQMTREVKPQIGPLMTKLNQTADQLQGVAANANAALGGAGGGQDANLPAALEQVTQAARSIRSLADYLGRHPEAVLKGKRQ